MNNDLLTHINWLAVLVAAIAYFILGAIWFSKMLFAKKWVQYHQINMQDPNVSKGMGRMMFGSFILMAVITIGIALLVERLQLSGWMSGAKWGLLTGVCFSFTAISITYLYTKKPFSLHLIDGMYHVVGQVIVAIILCEWQ